MKHDEHVDWIGRHTTTKMILRDTAQTLIEAVTKSNDLIKWPTIDEGGRFIYRGTKK
jgi:hypothetical protein